jgi:riboflavin kinase/FMN adenylyltransferase
MTRIVWESEVEGRFSEERFSEERWSDGCVVTIGVFDGVHQGHRRVLHLVRELANSRSLDAVCVTFDRHPAQVVRPDSAPRLITGLDHKLELIAATNLLDLVAVIGFDEERSKESAEDFVREVLVERMRARLVVVGADFHFGHGRTGNVAMLDAIGADLGFEVLGLGLVAPPDDPGHVAYSSTRIRQMLSEGDVRESALMLGRPHEVRGVVAHGDARGREIGFPTANVLVPSEILLPSDGIYAGTVLTADGVEHPSAISLGRRPTFYADQGYSLLEAHLLDFEGDLYGQAVAVRFIEWIRDEAKYDSVEALTAQIQRDCNKAREILSA